MTKYAMAIDLDRCVGCRACVIACKAEWGLEDENSRCWVKPIGPEETADGMGATFYTGLCNHCDKPACIEECPTGATYKTETGSVVVDKDLCIGCGNCAISCPYGARYISAIDKKAEKCTFCKERLANDLLPACVVTCPTEARIFGNMEDEKSDIYQAVIKGDYFALASRLHNLEPNVYYRGKPRDLGLLMKYYAPDKSSLVETNLAWKNLNPMILSTLGLTSLGVVGAFLAQLFFGEQDGHD